MEKIEWVKLAVAEYHKGCLTAEEAIWNITVAIGIRKQHPPEFIQWIEGLVTEQANTPDAQSRCPKCQHGWSKLELTCHLCGYIEPHR